MPEASRTLSKVGTAAGFAWASTVAGVAKSAETAEARKSFFIAGPFSLWKDEPASAQPMPDFFLFPINGLRGSREWNNEIPRTCVGHNKVVMHHSRAVGQPQGDGVNPRARLDRRRKTRCPRPAYSKT